jgi:hypothetical protein
MWNIYFTVLLVALLVALVPAFMLQRRMRELWLLPGVVSAILTVSAARNWSRFGIGTAYSIALDLSFPALCAAISVWEGIRVIKRRQSKRVLSDHDN